ncbi:MAG: hypothetical protein ACOYMG_11895 [Candidatus Methylumidiphilus sp.]
MYFDHCIKNRSVAFVCALRRWINVKAAGLILLALAYTVFGDALLLAIIHSLHLLFEVVELAVEHFLESAFGLTPRQAQFVLAYTGLGLGIYLLIKLVRWAYLAVMQTCLAAKGLAKRVAESARNFRDTIRWPKTAIAFGAICASIYLLS